MKTLSASMEKIVLIIGLSLLCILFTSVCVKSQTASPSAVHHLNRLGIAPDSGFSLEGCDKKGFSLLSKKEKKTVFEAIIYKDTIFTKDSQTVVAFWKETKFFFLSPNEGDIFWYYKGIPFACQRGKNFISLKIEPAITVADLKENQKFIQKELKKELLYQYAQRRAATQQQFFQASQQASQQVVVVPAVSRWNSAPIVEPNLSGQNNCRGTQVFPQCVDQSGSPLGTTRYGF
jgi:hypothetical protein